MNEISILSPKYVPGMRREDFSKPGMTEASTTFGRLMGAACFAFTAACGWPAGVKLNPAKLRISSIPEPGYQGLQS